MDGHGETSIPPPPPYNFVVGGITTDHLFRPSTMRSMTVSDDQQGLLWLPKSRSQKNRQVPVLKVRSQFRSQLKFLQGANFFEPKLWMIACTTTSFMYKWSGFVCTNVNVCIVLLFFISISSSKKIYIIYIF